MIELAVIVPLFSLSAKRKEIFFENIKRWGSQSISFHLYIPHLIFEISEMLKFEEGELTYLPVMKDDHFRDIWHKESLCNYAAKKVEEPYILFLDSDIYSRDEQWFQKIVEALKRQKNVALQPYLNVRDEQCSSINFSSAVAFHFLTQTDYPPHGAGTAWAFSREYFEQLGGFDSQYLEGSGDSAFLSRFIDSTSPAYSSYLLSFKHFSDRLNKDKHLEKFNYLPNDLIHCHHGSERYYPDRLTYYALLTKSPLSFCERDEDGFFFWKDSSNILRQLNRLLLNKLNSAFSSVSRTVLEQGINSGELCIPEYSLFTLNSRHAIQLSHHNWAFIHENENCFDVEFLRPLGTDLVLQIISTTVNQMPFDKISLASASSAKECFLEEYLQADYQPLLPSDEKEKAAIRRITFSPQDTCAHISLEIA